MKSNLHKLLGKLFPLLFLTAIILTGCNPEQSNEELKKKAENGDAKAQFALGDKYAVEKNFSEAAKWYEKAAEQGVVDAQNNLSGAYFDGRGVEKNYAEALKWFRKAAEQGNVLAQYNLGNAYYNGKGVEKDYVEAYAWYNIAATSQLLAASVKNRQDDLEKEMSPDQIVAAKKRTEELKAENEARTVGKT